jgi:osmoprotectant transport system ATP-binding protein
VVSASHQLLRHERETGSDAAAPARPPDRVQRAPATDFPAVESQDEIAKEVRVIELEHVSHSYPHATSLDDVSLRVASGETVALIGPSGCGKSTLLKAVIGLVPPSRGRVAVDGVELQAANVLQLRQRVGYVIQSGGLFPHLSAVDNITLAARYLRRDPKWIDARVDELADLVQLRREVLQRYPTNLSGGQSQRVGLMRALMLDPAVLLLDEPLGALDPMVRHGLQEELRALFERLRKTVVIVTHDMAEAAFFASRLVLMRAGRIVQEGAYRDLATKPAQEFVSEFVRAQRGVHGMPGDA